MDDGENSPTCGKTRPTGHGVPNRGHREMEGVLANSSRPRRQPEDAAGEVAAMAGGKEHTGARG